MLGRAAAQIVRIYQLTVSRMFPSRCRFEPSCSQYAIDALRTRGLVVGLGKSAWRLLRCAPWSAGGHDPVAPAPAEPRGYAEAGRG